MTRGVVDGHGPRTRPTVSRVASDFPPQGGGGRRHLLRSRPNPAETARKRAGVVRGRSPAGLLVPAHGAGRKEILRRFQ
jgi:hypothetical protein